MQMLLRTAPTTFSPTPPSVVAPPATTQPAPRTDLAASFLLDITEASRLAHRAVDMIGRLPLDDTGSEATKDLRVRIYKTSLAAQQRLERQMEHNPADIQASLRTADAYLEDANWQLARKPSPDGRFDGVDIPGALRDASEGAALIDELLVAAGGRAPSRPPVPGPVPVPVPPSPSPSLPPAPPTQPPVDPGDGFPPPTIPDHGTPVPTPPTTTPGDDYPDEDEFPTDEKLGYGSSGGDS